MTKNNRYIATLILALVSAGFLLSHPFSQTFWGKLVSSICYSAMIGGIADWFGITALFRKPLGIPFRTEIIPRNREKIFDSLVSMVEDELLTKENLINKLDKYSVSERMIHYMDFQGGKQDVHILMAGLARNFFNTIDRTEVNRLVREIMNEGPVELKAAPLVIDALELTLDSDCDDSIITFAINEIKEIISSPQIDSILAEMVQEIYRKIQTAAERESAGRKLIFKFAFSMIGLVDMTPVKLSKKLSNEALKYLNGLSRPGSENREKFKNRLNEMIDNLKENSAAQQTIDSLAADIIRKIDWGSLAIRWAEPYFKEAREEKDASAKLEQDLEALVERLLENFKNSPARQKQFDELVKGILTRLINEKHAEIGKLVRQRLELLSNDMIIEMIESKAGNDLQIIRINGSLVGGLAGMTIFLLTYWLYR